MRSSLVMFFSLLLLLASEGICGEKSARVEMIDFSFSSDPTVAVLRITHIGGTTGLEPSFTLYGDGRLEYRLQEIHGKVFESYDITLEYSEMTGIIRLIADHNLITISTESLLKKVDSRPNGQVTIKDGSYMVLEVRLESLRIGDVEHGSVSNEIQILDPNLLARYYPEVRELQGLLAINRRMSQFRRAAQREQARKE